jgi:hypothetical protein
VTTALSPLRLFADRAASTLAGGISPTSVTLNLTAGGGALFPNPNPPNFFAATLIDAATGLLDEIVWCTARTGDVLTIIRGQENTVALTFNAGDLFQKLLTSGDMSAMLQSNQLFVPATTFFVNGATGNDNNTGTSATVVAGTNIGPFRTLAGAANTVSQFFSTNQVTVNVAVGTDAGATFQRSLISGWNVVGAGPGSTIFNANAPQGILIFSYSSTNSLSNCTVGNTSTAANASAIGASGGAILTITNVTSTTMASSTSQFLGSGIGGTVSVVSFTIASSIAFPLIANGSGANVQLAGATILIPSTVGSTTFATATNGGQIQANQPNATTISGSGIAGYTGVRFNSTINSIINTGGAGVNFFPGSAAGSFSNGGQYI